MNIASVNTSANHGVAGRGSCNIPVWKKGQILEGRITKVSCQISINFNDREVKVSPSAVRNAREGETRKFEIMEVSKESIVLKEVGSNALGSGTIQMAITKVDTGQAVFSEQMNLTANEKKKDGQLEVSKNHLGHSANNMTEEDYKDVTDSQITIEEYTAAQLDMAIARVKEQRAFDQSMLEQQVERINEGEEQVEEIAENKAVSSEFSKEISERLKKANVPVTEENIKKLMESLDLIQSAGGMKPDSYRYLIENQMPATAENIYKACFIGKKSETPGVSDKVWDELRSQAEAVIMQSGIAVTEDSLQDAKWILDNDIPLTQESMKRLTALREMSDHMKPDQAMERMIEGMRSGQSPEQVNLEAGTEDIAKKFIQDLKTISDDAVTEAVKTADHNYGDITMRGLREAQKKVDSRKLENIQKFLPSVDYDISLVKAKRQLEEIRLKMTADTAVRMIGKGIDLNVAGLNKLVEELRETENSYYRSLLKDVTAQEAESTISTLRETEDFLQDLKTFPSFVLGSTISQIKTATIRELHTEGNDLKVKLEKANIAYDTLKTEPRSDLGDSMKKAFQSVDRILEDIDMEATDANRRAVRILGYNSMEITEKSVNQIKAFDSQVNDLMNHLHPAVTLELIKNGTNPLDTPIVDLNKQISDIRKGMEVSDDEKYSKFLWKLQKESGISSEDRKAYIGVYRLLNNIEKTDGAAIGSLIQAGQEVTLNNLLRAVRTIKSGGINQTINDKFGELESLTFQTEPISEQLAAAFHEQSGDEAGNEETDYQQKLLENIIDSISPSKLKNLGNKDKIMESSLELLKEQLVVVTEDKAEDAFAKEQVKALKELTLNSEAALRFLNDLDMPDTIGNIMRANQVMSSSGNPLKLLGLKLKGVGSDEKEEVKEAIDGFTEALTDQDTMQEQYNRLDQTVKHILKNEYSDNRLTAKDLADLKNLTSGITFTRDLAKKEYYQIPLSVGDSITNIHLTIVHNGESKGKLKVKVDSEQLGHITGDFQVTEGKLKGSVLADNQKGMDQMKAYVHNFEQECSESDLSLQQIHFGTVKGSQSSYVSSKGTSASQPQNDVNTKQLYKAAKAFVRLVKQAEE